MLFRSLITISRWKAQMLWRLMLLALLGLSSTLPIHAQQIGEIEPVIEIPDELNGTSLPDSVKPPLMAQTLSEKDAFFKKLDSIPEQHTEQEALLRDWLLKHPEDEEAQFYLAKVLSWQAKYEESLALYHQLLTKSPKNTDYLLGYGSTLLWDKKPEQALSALNDAKSTGVKNEDLYRTLIQVLFQLRKDKELKAVVKEAQQKFPDSKWEVPKPESEAGEQAKALGLRPLEIDAGSSFDLVSNNFDTWNGQYINIRKVLSQRAGIYVGSQRTSRFDIQDFDISGGTYFPLGKTKWGANIAGSISPTGEVLPKWSSYGELNRQLPFGFVAHAGFRHTEYKNAQTELGIYTLEHYFKRLRSSYSLYNNYLQGVGWSNSHVGLLEYTYGKHENTVRITGALGQELTNFGPRGVLPVDVRALYLGGTQWLLPRFGVTYSLGVTKQGDLYTRRGIQFGLRYLF